MAGDRETTVLAAEPVSGETIRELPFTFARRYGVILGDPVDGPGDRMLYLRGDSPLEALLEIQRVTGTRLQPLELTNSEFDQRLQERYGQRSGGASEVVDDLGDEIDLERIADTLSEPEDLLESEDDAPIIRLINAMLGQAIKEEASDIHIEPTESAFSVRIRVDGQLREILQARRSLIPLVVSRIKVMANLDIAEKRLPQDGRIAVRVAGRAVDIRVSTLPSNHGERVVLRLLDKQAKRLDLAQLGFLAEIRKDFAEVIHQPHGIILVTGPTGSGKTTTLYAALSRLNEVKRNIMTVEDPIEYDLPGISQSQVNLKAGFTFARGLRAILRQDPDVVMVGEVRDLDTAEIAVQASLTGHLVLSTLHTNTAVGAITRMRDMGIEPFLLASSIIGVLAQRLVRVLCPHCREGYSADESEARLLGIGKGQPAPTIYRSTGCSACSYQGYRGRTGIYELVIVDKAMQSLIHDAAGEIELEQKARERTPAIYDDGIAKILDGTTSLDEVLRVTREA